MFFIENIEGFEQTLKKVREFTKGILGKEHSRQREQLFKFSKIWVHLANSNNRKEAVGWTNKVRSLWGAEFIKM